MSAEERAHFDRISRRYADAAESWSVIYERVAALVDPLIGGRRVLDIGSGGVFPYDTNRAAEVIAVDASPGMLERIDAPHVSTLLADARALDAVADASIDVVLFVLSLHHINGESHRASRATLESVLAEARRKLRPGGHLVVVEPVLPPALVWIESLAFPLTRALLARLGVSMVFFYAESFLRERMARHLGIEPAAVRVERVVVERIDPLGGTFPGWIRIPSWMHPFSHCLLCARLPQG